jgi:GT2 family glycosyltransferase
VPQAKIVHYGGQSTRQVAASMFIQLYRSKVLFFRKNQGPWIAAAYKLVLLAVAIPRLMLTPLAWLEPRESRERHLTLANHYWSLLWALPSL